MNYLIWNGKDTRDIDGLLICELPPITKPKMRTKITTIDGRDGSIVENLGYESYTKEILIGITHTNDLDKIIKFFTGNGEVIFSNEPDKYYKAQIFKEIDYERLIRYKTAKVVFYCQPFKYKVREPEFTFNITNQTSVMVSNVGLEDSKPIITLYGSGDVTFTLNGIDVFNVDIESDYITIDSEKQEAYKGGILKNRQMSGDFPMLKSGINTITWTGTLTKIVVDPKSRWL